MIARVGLIALLLALVVGGAFYFLNDGSSDRGRGSGPEDDGTAVATPADGATLDEANVVTTAGAQTRDTARRVVETKLGADGTSAEVVGEAAEVDRSTVAILAGELSDEDGHPVAGARIVASRSLMEAMAAEQFGGMGGMMGGDAEAIYKEAETDVDGRFEIVGIPAGQPALRISAVGFVPHQVTDLSIAAREHVSLDKPIVLERSCVVSGVVVDAAGSPVEGASVKPVPKSMGLMGAAMSSMTKGGTETDALGQFRLNELVREEVKLVVSHPSYLNGELEVDAREGEAIDGLSIALEKGATITGRLVGVPRGQTESVQVVGVPDGFNMGGFQPRTAKVAADGSFELGGLPESSVWNVGASELKDDSDLSPANAMQMLFMDQNEVAERVEAKAGDTNVELLFRPAVSVSFKVVNSVSGAPISDLEVRTNGFGGWGSEVEHYPGGLVKLEGLRFDEAKPEIYVAVDAVGYSESSDNYSVTIGESNDLGTIELVPAPVTQVLVVAAKTGEPIADARVQLSQAKANHTPEAQVLEALSSAGGELDMDEVMSEISNNGGADEESDENGVAHFEFLAAGDYKLTVIADGFAPLELQQVTVIEGSDVPIRAEMGLGSHVTVLVTDAKGHPLPARKVAHQGPDEDERPWWFRSGEGELVTDAKGRAVFRNLGPGEHGFRLLKPVGGDGQANMMALMMAFRDSDDEEVEWETVQVQAESSAELTLVEQPTGSLVGTITEAGRPLSRAKLTLRAVKSDAQDGLEDESSAEAAFMAMGEEFFGGGGPTAKTERDGTFEFQGVDVGEYVLEIDSKKRAMKAEFPVTIAPGDQALNFDLELAILAGRVVDENGKGILGLDVQVAAVAPKSETDDAKGAAREIAGGLMSDLMGGSDRVRSVRTRAKGKFELRGVTPDTPLVITVDGRKKGYRLVRSDEVSVRPNESKDDLELVVQLGGTIDVTVVNADGSPTEFVLVRITRTDIESEPENEMAVGGKKTLDGLEPGTYRVQADDNPDEDALFGGGDPSQIGKVEQTVRVEPGKTVTLELRLP